MWNGTTPIHAEPSKVCSSRPAGSSGASAGSSTRQCRKQRSCHDIRIAQGAVDTGHGRAAARRAPVHAPSRNRSRSHGAGISHTSWRPKMRYRCGPPAGRRRRGPARGTTRSRARWRTGPSSDAAMRSTASLSTGHPTARLDQDHAVGQQGRYGRRRGEQRAGHVGVEGREPEPPACVVPGDEPDDPRAEAAEPVVEDDVARERCRVGVATSPRPDGTTRRRPAGRCGSGHNERVPDHAAEAARVTNLELFFDLVFVFTITQLTVVLTEHPTAAGCCRWC